MTLDAAMIRNGIHLAVLSALAVAQPLLDVLGKNPAFFAVRGSTATQIVLFALVVTLGVPAILVLIEVAVRALDGRAAHVVHLVFVGSLVGVFVLYALTKADAFGGALELAVAAGVGIAAAVLYDQASAARSFLTVLAPIPVVILALFLFNSPVSKLVVGDQPEVRAATVASKTPVVLIVFDEFSTVSLMDRRERIDAVRFPSFAALARDATWYRNATTEYWLSEVAVPTVLTGQRPVPGKLPIASEYPHSVFTLVGGSYRIRAIETLTHLCPRTLCRETRATAQAQAVPNTFRSFASDVGTVYLHMVLPESYTDRLPAISDAWGNFGKETDAEEAVKRDASGDIEACARNICRFAELIDGDRRPTLYVLHSLLPHVPYVYLPSGQRYAVDARLLRGVHNGRWLEAWPAQQAYQRYLLQVGYADRALGLLLRRLRETGVYDRGLVIVTADHGVGFRLADQRRLPTPTNLDEIAFVPLFVKLPGQHRGRISDAPAKNLDAVPTIARVLGLPLRTRLEGRPLVGSGPKRAATVTVLKQDGSRVTSSLAELRSMRSRALGRQVAAFGSGPFERVYRVGPHSGLLGRSVSSLRVVQERGARVKVDDTTLLDSVDRSSGFLPSFLEGRLLPSRGRTPLAIALNGSIAAVTWTFAEHGQTRFSALVPGQALRDGRNAVEVFVIEVVGGAPRLARLAGSEVSLTLRDGGAAIQSGARRIPVRPGSLRGSVHATREPAGWVFTGFAAQRRRNERVDAIIVFVGDRAIYVGRADNLKPQAILGQPELGKTGFEFELPPSLLPEPATGRAVRVYALDGGVATELRYRADFPWP